MSYANLLVYEGFEYSVGNLAGNNGGTGFSAAWAQNGGNIINSQVIPGSFSYTDVNGYSLVTSGNRSWVSGDTSVNGANLPGGTSASAQPLRTLNNIYGLGADVSGSYSTWVSFLALRTDPASPAPAGDNGHSRAASVQFFYNATTTSTAAGSEMFGVGRATQSSETDATLPNDTWAVLQAGSAVATKASTVSFASAPADFILMRIDHIGQNATTAGNADTLRVWINPTDLNLVPSDASANIIFNSGDFAGQTRDWVFDRIRLFGGNAQGTVGTTYSYGQIEMDEFRLGTTFSDVTPNVIPEPTMAALLGLGGLAMISHFRRSRG